MANDVIVELHMIAENIKNLNTIIQSRSGNFWNTQWFAALIGGLSATIATIIIGFFTRRNQRMNDIYHSLMSDRIGLQPDYLVKSARGFNIPKKINEKTVIELRRRCKFWQFPISRIRYLFCQYEKAIWQLPDIKTTELEDTGEYKNLQEIFQKISDLIEKKTGENEYTRR